MVVRRVERHQVDDVDDPHAQLRDVLAQQRGRGQRLHGRDVAGAGQHDVGLVAAGLGAGPVPDRGAARAVVARRVDVEALQLRLLVDDDEVDVVAAAQAVVGDREQAVGVRRQVDARRPRRFSEIIVSISPGPWWLNPLWSLRQQVEVSSTFSEDTGARQRQLARLLAATSRAGWPSTPTTMANAS